MATRHVVRSLPGLLATLLAVGATAGLAVTCTASLFYEAWGQPIPRMLSYLTPAVALLVLCLVALRWPRVGAVLLMVAGLGAGALWMNMQLRRGMAPLDELLVTVLVMIGPVIVAALLFLFEARHRRLLREEGAPVSPRWTVRNYRYLLLVGVPLLGVAILTFLQLPALVARHDDGLRGARILEGNGVTLEWAPQGPGWNQQEPGIGSPSWEVVVRYGNPPRDRCAFLNEGGTALLGSPTDIWRMPTADEIVRSLTRDGENAGCAWDGRSSHATCRRDPDKETPLWAPDEAPIYYWSSQEAGTATAFAVNYTGGISVLPKSMAGQGIGFRCVRAVVAH